MSETRHSKLNRRPPPDGADHSIVALYRLLVESVTDYAIFVLDVSGNVLSWNPGAERLKGWRADEIVGRNFERLYAASDRTAGKPRECSAPRWNRVASRTRAGACERTAASSGPTSSSRDCKMLVER